MSEQIKGHSTMGLPRASGKRRWSGEDGGEALPAAKVICTSPPHALCAEDVLHHPALTHAHATTPALECELTSGATGDPSTTRLEQEELPPGVPGSAPPCLPGHHAFPEESEDDDSDDDHDDFIDDEEDKDSGFIDSNSIDNSSDDEVENRVISGDAAGESCSSTSSSSTTTTTTSTTTASTSLQLSLSKVLPPTSTSSQATPPPAPTLTMSQVPILLPSPPLPLTVYTPTLSNVVACTTIPLATTNTSPSSPVVVQAPITPPLVAGHTTTPSSPPPPPFAPFPSLPTSTFLLTSVSTTTTCTTTTATSTPGTSTEEPGPKTLPSEGSITTVTATQTSTVVTSTYQGALSSPVYEPHPFSYPGESYPSRPSTPTWESCNYYDGSQPTTNKYMEISPNKSTSSQSIQCDENGKSYLELGSASPYTHTYSSDCGNYTTSPSSYPAQSYNQTYTSPSSYGQPNSYYGPRQSYSPGPYVYPTGENYTAFEGENGCSYNYGGNAYGGVRGSLLPSRGPPRCMSPYCDPTRSSPRPSCYHQQRLSVLNMSMYKLNRFRQFPDPSLHRSVLICNTLRHIERELEAEGVSVASLLAHSHGHPAHPHLQGASLGPGSPPCPEPMPSSSPSPPAATETPLSSMHTPPAGSPLAAPSTPPPPSTPGTPPPATHYTTPVYPTPHYLPTTDHASASAASYDSRETVHMRPYPNLVANTSHDDSREGPSGVTADSAEGESSPATPPPRPAPAPQEERTDAINWCSVLSLSSQTDLDSMNNNEYGEWSSETGSGSGSGELDYSRPEDGPPWKLPSLSAEDVLKSFPEASKRLEANEDLDSIINVLVGS